MDERRQVSPLPFAQNHQHPFRILTPEASRYPHNLTSYNHSGMIVDDVVAHNRESLSQARSLNPSRHAAHGVWRGESGSCP